MFESAQCPYREEGLEVEPAEQDAMIRAGEEGNFSALRLHRFRIATLVAEDDRRPGRLIARPAAILWKKLLRTR